MVKFSIIVPVYQVESYLERCLDSLLAQTCSDCEIVLVDDGSRDRSGEICDQYAARDSRIKVYHKQNGGLSSARNYGIDHASGEYVLFVDSDDYVEKELCAVLKEAQEQYPQADALIYGGLEESHTGVIRSLRNKELESVCVWKAQDYMLAAYRERDLAVQASLYAYRRRFLNENGLRFREGILHEDVEFTPRALLKAGQIVEIPGNYYHYMVRGGSISTGKNQEKNIVDLFRTLEEQSRMAEGQEPELCRWMKDAALNSYLNMIYENRMYRPEYRKLIRKKFMLGKAATFWNRTRVILCMVSVRLYCGINTFYKKIRCRRELEL